MAPALQNRSEACHSVRTDWLSFTVQLHEPEAVDDLHDYLGDLSNRVSLTKEEPEPGPSRFFERKIRYGSGVQFQYSPPQSAASEFRPGKNEGLASIEIPGSVWGFLTVENRRKLIVDVRRWPGFKKVTRLDLQMTLLDQAEDAEWIVGEVAAGRLWPKGFGKGMAYVDRNLHGEIVGACTQYFGSKESRIRSRHYDKAAEAGWSTPAVRHEVQLREEPADQHFRRLSDRCQAESSGEPLLMEAEKVTVKDALGTLVDFRDTSRWAGRHKPTNWAQSAPIPEFWSKAIGPGPTPLQVEYRRPGGLQEALDAAVVQYGRRIAQGVLLELVDGAESLAHASAGFILSCLAQLDEGDWKELALLRPGLDQRELRDWFLRQQAIGLNYVEAQETTDEPAPPS